MNRPTAAEEGGAALPAASLTGTVLFRYLAKGTLELQSSAHIGGGEEGVCDMSLLRDELGLPFIPGSSLAGSGASHLARRLHPWSEFSGGRRAWSRLKLFSYEDAVTRAGTMSPLSVQDACIVKNTLRVAVRDGVRIDHSTGVAADTSKFDYEVLEPGTRFKLVLECQVRDTDPHEEIKEQFLALLWCLSRGEIRLGKRTRRGLGRGEVEKWEITCLDMTKKEHVLSWLKGTRPADAGLDLPGACPLP